MVLLCLIRLRACVPRTHARTHTCALTHTESQWVASLCSSMLPLSSVACSTWVKTVMVSCGCVVTLCPCSRSGMPVHLQTGKHLPETWDGITQSPLLRPGRIWRAGLSSTQPQTHITHRGRLLPAYLNLQIFSFFLMFIFSTFSSVFFSFIASMFFPPLIFFIHQQMHPRVKSITGARSSDSSCFCSDSLICC